MRSLALRNLFAPSPIYDHALNLNPVVVAKKREGKVRGGIKGGGRWEAEGGGKTSRRQSAWEESGGGGRGNEGVEGGEALAECRGGV